MKNKHKSIKFYAKFTGLMVAVIMSFTLTACGTGAAVEIEKTLVETGKKQVTKKQEETDLSNVYETRAAIETCVADKGIGGKKVFRVILDTNNGCIRIERPNGVGGKDFLTQYGINDADCVANVYADWSGNIICTYENYSWTDNTSEVHGQYLWADGSSY